MASEEKHQSFRSSPNGRIVKVEAFYHEETRQYLVDWDDIMDVFPNVSYVLNGDAAVARARDSRRKHIEPRCIKYYQDVVLEVVMADVSLSEAQFTFPGLPISRAAVPDVSMDRDPTLFHYRTTSTASSHLTFDSLLTNARPDSVDSQGYLLSPPEYSRSRPVDSVNLWRMDGLRKAHSSIDEL
ncbi:hypothetical protein BGW39_002692 [Mortierella sp. 14UC]|nr:hypothetical protein BGW39_002692 [Mortierella sp. 14UC]